MPAYGLTSPGHYIGYIVGPRTNGSKMRRGALSNIGLQRCRKPVQDVSALQQPECIVVQYSKRLMLNYDRIVLLQCPSNILLAAVIFIGPAMGPTYTVHPVQRRGFDLFKPSSISRPRNPIYSEVLLRCDYCDIFMYCRDVSFHHEHMGRGPSPDIQKP